MASLARVRLFGARAAQPVARRMARGKATAVEATAPEAALQPKKTYSAGDKQLMEAEYTEDIGHLFGEKVRRLPPPSPPITPPRLQRRLMPFRHSVRRLMFTHRMPKRSWS